MTWFKVDDGLHSSRKVLILPRSVRLSAIGLWTLAGSWSASEELDGHVPDYMVTELGGTPRIVAALVTAGLWESIPDGSQFSKWAEYQPTRADLEAARSKEAERKRLYRSRHSPEGVPLGQTEGHQPESGHPDPTRPDPTLLTTPKGVGARKRGTRIPEPFIVNGEMRAWAAKRVPGVDVDRATEKFVNYWRAKTSQATKLDWRGTWDNWLLSDFEKLPGRGAPAKPSKADRARGVIAQGQRLQAEIDRREIES